MRHEVEQQGISAETIKRDKVLHISTQCMFAYISDNLIILSAAKRHTTSRLAQMHF